MKKAVQPKKPRPKFIDRLEKELTSVGIIIKRGNMTDWSFDKNGKRSEYADDFCEWIKIILKTEDESKKYEVEFFFHNNSKTLDGVKLYVKKRKRGYGGGKLIGLDKPKQPLEKQPDSQPKPDASLTTSTPNHRVSFVC